MRVYVSTYAKYNKGSLYGAWLDLSDYSDIDEFTEACAELHFDEEDPEYMFQDHEDIPAGMISESSIKPEIFELANMDSDDLELLTIYREHVNQDGDLEEARDAFMGTYDSPEDYAAEYWEQSGELDSVPDALRHYIDWQCVARDMGYEGVTFIRDGACTWVFSG